MFARVGCTSAERLCCKRKRNREREAQLEVEHCVSLYCRVVPGLSNTLRGLIAAEKLTAMLFERANPARTSQCWRGTFVGANASASSSLRRLARIREGPSPRDMSVSSSAWSSLTCPSASSCPSSSPPVSACPSRNPSPSPSSCRATPTPLLRLGLRLIRARGIATSTCSAPM